MASTSTQQQQQQQQQQQDGGLFDAIDACPPHVAAAILSRLSVCDLAVCASVCRAWRARMPYGGLVTLKLHGGTDGGELRGFDAGRLLPRSAPHLQEIVAPGAGSAPWHATLRVLRAARLPALRRVEIQHWSPAGGVEDAARELAALAEAMEAQSGACRLELAVNSRDALAALAQRPPREFPRLARVDANLPYLHDGAADALCQVAAARAARVVVRVGVWCCSWGGCDGLRLADALELKRRLGGACAALGVVGIADGEDWARALAALLAPPGLEALALDFQGRGGEARFPPPPPLPPGLPPPPPPPPLRFAALARELGAAAVAGPEGVGLRRLALEGSPPGGWAVDNDGPCGEEGSGGGGGCGGEDAPLLRRLLCGVTRLSALRDASHAALPLRTLVPHLASTLKELVVQRSVCVGGGGCYAACSASVDALAALAALTALESLTLHVPLTPCAFPLHCDGHDRGLSTRWSRRPPLDLGWLRRLARLRFARLGVPFIALAWLPERLEALDARAALCVAEDWAAHVLAGADRAGGGGNSGGSGGGGGGGVAGHSAQPTAAAHIPALRRIALPSAPAFPSGGGDYHSSDYEFGGAEGLGWSDGGECSTGLGADFEGLWARGGGGGSGDTYSGGGSGGSSSGDGDSGAAEEGGQRDEHQEVAARLLEAVAAACPRLEVLDAGDWRAGAAAAAGAARTLRATLRRLVLGAVPGPEHAAVEAAVRAVAAPWLELAFNPVKPTRGATLTCY